MALAVCLVGCATTLRMLLAGGSSPGGRGDGWLVGAGVVGGCATWSTHFIAMLAFDPGVATGYDPSGTALSLMVVLIFAVLASFAGARLRGARRLLTWGVLFGAGVGGMHYLGMMAFRVQGVMSWRPGYVVASILIGMALAVATLKVLRSGRDVRRFVGASVLLALAIVSLHLTGMAGLVIHPDPRVVVPQGSLPRGAMALMAGGLTLVIATAALATIWLAGRAHASALQLLRTTFDAVPFSLAYYDAADRLALCNQNYVAEAQAMGFTAVIGGRYAEFVQQAVDARAVPAAIGREREWIADTLQRRREPSSVREQANGDGRVLQVSYNRTADGGLVTSLIDITELKRQAHELTMARDAARAADRAKSEFLANMSHELHTPMNGVAGAAQVLALEPLSPRQSDLVELIRSSGAALHRMLSDLLDVARLDLGTVEIKPAPYNLAAAVGRAADGIEGRAAQKGLRLTRRVAPEADALFLGDQERIAQILDHLLQNAVKFTAAGEIDLSLSVVEGQATIVVADTGVGFDPRDKERLFDRFEQADSSVTRRYGGAGLGLAISRGLAERMGGWLDAEVRADGGSEFILTLPLATAQRPRARRPTKVRAA